MNYQIIYTQTYIKKARKFFAKHSTLVNQYRKALELLEVNPFHPSLRLHRLKNNLDHLHSISINMQYRITLEFIVDGKKILLIDVGDHATVYR